ncbi:MAG: HepT-like ribonuclease domain-containing protein [Candidatus Bathyarchaeales archaeon]
MIRFRNLLIHVYAKVSPGLVYKIAKESAERDIKK